MLINSTVLLRPRTLIVGVAISCWLATVAFANTVPTLWESQWPRTDFSKLTVDPGEIISGGVPKDGIPAITDPEFIKVSEESRLVDTEPVIAIEINDIWRAYPIRYLIWHEIVNDQVGKVPIAVTYCPLCNSGIVFDRMINGEVLSFGVSGNLRFSDMIMYDRETESWWQQAIGTGIAGEHAGDELSVIPALTLSWTEYKEEAGEDAEVMDQPRYTRLYGSNPYVGYDTATKPFLYFGENPPHDIPPLARVVRIGSAAWPLERLRVEQSINEGGYQLEWKEGQSSPLDSLDIRAGREIGTVRVVDADSGNLVAHDILFAFAFHAFFPDGKWMLATQ